MMDLALTVDYELFGDGSGDVFLDVIEPTERILNICNDSKAKITIFFEVIEYWRLKEEWAKGNKMGYENDPSLAMETQMLEAYENGHDIQLHIHPQWINAEYNSKWIVDDNWCMKDIPLIKEENGLKMDLKEVLTKGKETLEALIKPKHPEYKCNIFRAGGFNILPSEPIIKQLEDLGFIMDSSVYAGGYDVNRKSNIDYRKIGNSVPYWAISKGNVLSQDEGKSLNEKDMIEVPIFAVPIKRYLKYDWSRIKILLKNRKSAQGTLQGRIEQRSFFEKIKFFFEIEHITWDFCLFNIKKTKMFLKTAKEFLNKSEKYFPFVIIGHSKGFGSDKTLKYLLKQEANFITMTEIFNKIEKN